MGFLERLKEINENYLTAGMPSAGGGSQTPQTAPPNNSGAATTGGVKPKHTQTQIKKPIGSSQNSNDVLTALLMRAAESEDGLDGLDEFDAYLDSVGIDKTRLAGSFGELSKRVGGI